MLREDLLDPEFRRRGREWRETLGRILDTCLEGSPGAGAVLATYWQGTLLWWSFDPVLPVTEYVRRELTAIVTTVLRPA